MPRCPHCQGVIDVQFIKAPPMQSDSVKPSGSIGDLESLLDTAEGMPLSGPSEKFVSETRERFQKYGKNTRMSDKQMAWLRRIAEGESAGRDEW